MTEELKEVGGAVGHPLPGSGLHANRERGRVGRLMRANGIVVERTRKFKATSDSDHTFNIAPNLLDRDFNAAGPNQKWAGDISYIWTREGWLYLAVIIDLHSRHRLGRQQPDEAGFGDPGAEDAHCFEVAWLHVP